MKKLVKKKVFIKFKTKDGKDVKFPATRMVELGKTLAKRKPRRKIK